MKCSDTGREKTMELISKIFLPFLLVSTGLVLIHSNSSFLETPRGLLRRKRVVVFITPSFTQISIAESKDLINPYPSSTNIALELTAYHSMPGSIDDWRWRKPAKPKSVTSTTKKVSVIYWVLRIQVNPKCDAALRIYEWQSGKYAIESCTHYSFPKVKWKVFYKCD